MDDDKVRVEARLPRDLVAWLDRLARIERRDRTGQLEIVLREARARDAILAALEGE